MSRLRVLICSPNDVQRERDIAAAIVGEFHRNSMRDFGVGLDLFRWEVEAYPGFFAQGPQELIDSLLNITDSDLVVSMFWTRLGTRLANGKTGTEHELDAAYESWKATSRPHVMMYFNEARVAPNDIDPAQLQALEEYKRRLPKESFWWTYNGAKDFESLFRQHLPDVLHRLRNSPRRETPAAAPVSFPIHDMDQTSTDGALVSSFVPDGRSGVFKRFRLPTTSGFVDNQKTINSIYVVKDPLRPFEIQIGELRARRPGGDPGVIVLQGGLSADALRTMYPFIVDSQYKWLRTVFAELQTDPEVLRYIYNTDPDSDIRKTAARNPLAPNEIKEADCLFCSRDFLQRRTLNNAVSDGAAIICNDFPYGPYFHYIAMPTDPVHTWDNVTEKHLRDMNLAVSRFLAKDKPEARERLRGSQGIRIGLNSSIRHLILGRSTRTSAGASVPHVHKQIWGMAPGSVNLGDHLASLCATFEKKGVDYLGCYLTALEEAGLVLWSDDNIALYVPMAQISVHELQAIVKRRNAKHFLQLTESEICSLSLAEAIVTKLYSAIGINSFNEVMLSCPFSAVEDDGFRLIATFLTREVDIAVSELNLLYVVDKHPSDTLAETKQRTTQILKDLGR